MSRKSTSASASGANDPRYDTVNEDDYIGDTPRKSSDASSKRDTGLPLPEYRSRPPTATAPVGDYSARASIGGGAGPAPYSPPPPPEGAASPTGGNPPKPKDPQMAFDLSGKPANVVCAERLDMDDRDHEHVNDSMKTSFLEVFAEPDPQYHSIACVWTLSFRTFEITRVYSYKILTLILGLPIALLAGFLFALFSFVMIWIAKPLLALFRMLLSQIVIIWPLTLMYIVRPFFYAVGAVFSTFRLHSTRGEVIKEIWETV